MYFMKKLRNILFAVTLVICGIFIGACGVQASAEQPYPLKIWMQNENGIMKTLCLVDEYTGVNYIVVSTDQGPSCPAIAISPRLNADGSLYVE